MAALTSKTHVVKLPDGMEDQLRDVNKDILNLFGGLDKIMALPRVQVTEKMRRRDTFGLLSQNDSIRVHEVAAPVTLMVNKRNSWAIALRVRWKDAHPLESDAGPFVIWWYTSRGNVRDQWQMSNRWEPINIMNMWAIDKWFPQDLIGIKTRDSCMLRQLLEEKEIVVTIPQMSGESHKLMKKYMLQLV